jgi:hypothetical protein
MTQHEAMLHEILSRPVFLNQDGFMEINWFGQVPMVVMREPFLVFLWIDIG